ncbi:MAG: hypothetical protein ABIH03_05740 [Pseudomonadota bacterium]
MNTNHPTPWTVCGPNILDAANRPVITNFVLTPSWALLQAQIVRCVNAHDALLEACRAIADADRLNMTEYDAAMRLVDAAIAKAEGRTA